MRHTRHNPENFGAAAISPLRAMISRMAAAMQPLWFEWGNVESWYLRKSIANIRIQQPIYISGLARAGTTLVLEMLASHPQVASFRYKDFPCVPLIYTWRRFIRTFGGASATRERSHADGMHVSADSPEAFEEMVWMYFFPGCHNESREQVMRPHERHPAFEAFYRNTVAKLLLDETATRYAAKGNYNISRIAYIQQLFPDARFIIAVRHPLAHIASLMKQHEWFCRAQKHYPALRSYMRQAGHFEFGLDRRLINLGSASSTAAIRSAWEQGHDVTGWAMYWNELYSYITGLLKADAMLRSRIHIIKYEDVLQDTAGTIAALFAHCNLELPAGLTEQWTLQIRPPDYYTAHFSPDEMKVVEQVTAETARFFGYTF